LKDLGGNKKPAAEAQKPDAPAVAVEPAAEKPAEAAPAPVAEKPAEAAPAAEKPAEAAPAAEKPAEAVAEPMAEKPAEAAPAAEKPAEAVAAPMAEKPAEEAPADGKPAEVAAAPAAEMPAEAAPAADKPADAAVAQDGGDTGSLVSELLTLETLRRKSLDDHGSASLTIARKALRDGDYPLARDQYKQALDFIGNRPDTVAAREEAAKGVGEAFYREAKLAMKKGDYEKALPLAVQAHDHGHPQAGRLVEALKKEPAKTAADASSITHRLNEPDYKEQRDDIRRLLRRSRQYFTTAEYDKSLESCELVLRDYPFNAEAMELRDRIADRMKDVADVEFEATRSLMIRDVRKTWTPERYAIESSQLPKSKGDVTSKQKVAQISGTKTSEQIVQQKLKDIVIPEVTFRPPATIIDAVDFFKQASRDYDKPEIPVEQRGVNLVLKLASNGSTAPAAEAAASADPFAAPTASSNAGGVPPISALSARFISLYDALKLVCDVTGMKFRIRGNIVMIVPANDPDAELVTRSYNVLATLSDRIASTASEMGAAAGGGGDTTFMTKSNMDSKQDWKVFFQQMGVVWPDGSSISYMATIGKLRVTNTTEQLAVFEQVLEDLNVTPRLIEIEARFVEVSQKDLNSLGFEWLLNSDLDFTVGGFLDKALGLKDVTTAGGGAPGGGQIPLKDSNGNPLFDANGNALFTSASSLHNASINKIDGNNFTTGNRYLSTTGNPISGSGANTNDKFMRVNAFLGNADLSMILHMLSQRSDTDLLSAPKVVTKSGQEAVMKVVTEYIYPTEFEVTGLQSGGSGNNSTSTTTGAVVEPQNFEMREVGVILQVVPEVSAEGQMINLMLNPQVVSEPVWKNYGAKIPIPRQSSVTATLTGISPTDLANILNQPPEFMELPMEQPFFHVRSVQTQLSIYNGATVVMGGLITEARTTIEDKIPLLGDIPYIGRLFRSRAEQSDKRNLLVFVTARLVDPAGRSVRTSGGESALMSGGGTSGAVSGKTVSAEGAQEADAK
jgi:general secretion pathway protein D